MLSRQHVEEMLITFKGLRLEANPNISVKKETLSHTFSIQNLDYCLARKCKTLKVFFLFRNQQSEYLGTL